MVVLLVFLAVLGGDGRGLFEGLVGMALPWWQGDGDRLFSHQALDAVKLSV